MPLFVGGPLDGHRREFADDPKRVEVPLLESGGAGVIPWTDERRPFKTVTYTLLHLVRPGLAVYSALDMDATVDALVARYPGAPESDWIGDIPSELSVLADKFEESGSAEWAVLLRRAATEIDGLRSALSERNEMLQNPLRFLTRPADDAAPAEESPGSRSQGRGT